MRKKIMIRLLVLFLGPYILTEILFSEGYESALPIDFRKKEERIQIEIKEYAGIYKIDMENYILGILPMVIPASYELEAIKAQAILLRTQLIREYKETGKAEGITEQIQLSQNKLKSIWGNEYYDNIWKFKQAVDETKGLYLAIEGEPIMASYFLVSNGNTRSGKEVLGKDFEYLKSVQCEKDFLSHEYLFERQMSIHDFCSYLYISQNELRRFEICEDSNGYCVWIRFYKKEQEKTMIQQIGGEQFRILFSLPSTSFDIEIKKDKVVILGKGKGHGLGMSQYGANKMAESGKDFMEILSYYFSGVTFDKFE